MAFYAIGDVHGCLGELQRLLEVIRFDESRDRLWFVGDLINRGPESLGVLSLVRGLGERAVSLLGNHEMRALALLNGRTVNSRHRTYMGYLLECSEREEIAHWLTTLPVMARDDATGYAMVHAGIHPSWSIDAAWRRAVGLAAFCASPQGLAPHVEVGSPPPPVEPDPSQPLLRLWYHAMSFTSIRLCNRQGMALWPGQASQYGLEKSYLWPPDDSPFRPWFEILPRPLSHKLLYGHWAAAGLTLRQDTIGLDSGCVYGGKLTALRLDSEAPFEERLFQVTCGRYADKDD
ncbi:MAG: symmetrical bis(5'-nucleosyl)-tetraphosphatase [Magnetococcales bacterium]|nr:symmetrical bis(5'-nucleosyl)-tetraphosphatase [Magnetococcales bacterium]NGZ27773.1 symmetrical bis(5'-nucleosyl)-tetraphosphatase [Magnetococcales bacterium]